MNRLAMTIGLAIVVGVPSATTAADRSARFTPVDRAEFTPAFVPWATSRDARATVMVVLDGAPVAVAQEASAARLGRAEKENIERTLKSRQVAFAREVRARGGEVLGAYQHAVNGLKVRVARRDLAALAAMPGVAGLRPIAQVWPDVEGPANAVSVPYIGAPTAWDDVGVRGENVKVAVIDTGIDYTHANFGGPGTPADYEAAFAAGTAPPDASWFGPAAPKVKGGTDLVGDGYDASSADPAVNTPNPDPNPLDCNGHGSHVAGTTAGFGVTSAGARYTGPYTAAAFAATSWRVGPGVAPLADLYAVRVFGCEGSTDVTVDAIEWAVANDMDVINMSLGSPFGSADDASALASENAARAGVLVVTSAGNSGHQLYLSGSPGSGNRVIATAATDATTPVYPAVSMALSNGSTVVALNSNGAALPTGALAIHVMRTATGAISLGCAEAEYQAAAAQIAGKLVVSLRGVCARVDRAIFGEKYGAAAAAMINNAAGYPPFEGQIPTSQLAAGHVTIPFLGIRGTGTDPGNVVASASATLTATTLPNTAYELFASFTSGGPRNGDSALKPTISAPGVSIDSTLVGSGNGGFRLSGTSMASPHVAGVAALVKQAHPRWSASQLRAAILGTADPSPIRDYEARLGGAGLVQPSAAVRTQVVPVAQPGRALNLSFGFAELKEGAPFSGSDEVIVVNRGRSAATFDVTSAPTGGVPHTVSVWPARLTVRGGGEATVEVSLKVPAGTAGNSDAYRDVAGFVTLTPASGSNGGIALRVPYYMVPRARSDIESRASGLRPTGTTGTAGATARLANEEGSIEGSADFYAWGPTGAVTPGAGTVDLRAVGVQAWNDSQGRRTLVFAVNVHNRFNTAAVNEYDVYVDSNLDGVYDFAVVGIDFGLVTTGSFDGRVASAVFNLRTGAGVIRFLGFAPSNGSTVLLPVRASDLGVTGTNPRFAYTAEAFSYETGAFDATGGSSLFNAFTSAVSTGDFALVPVGGTVDVPLAIDNAEWALTPPTGVMVVNLDDKAGRKQADLLPAR